MYNQYDDFKDEVAKKLNIAHWQPTNREIYLIALSVKQRNCEPNKQELLNIVQTCYNGEILYFSNEGIDNSDLITVLNLASQIGK